MARLVSSVAVALVSLAAAIPAQAGSAVRETNFPIDGIVVPGKTIGGIALGMTQLQVEQHWGRNFSACGACGRNLTWLYEYPGGDAALGAAVKFSTLTAATASSGAAAAAAAKKASASALAATRKASTAQTLTARAAITAKTDAARAAAAKAAAARAKAARATTLERVAAAAAARAAAAKLTEAKDASIAAAARSAANAADIAAAKAATAAKAAAAASTSGTVIAVFTLGSPAGWGLVGVKMGDPVTNVYNLYGNPGDTNCVGYGALTVTAGNATTSFYTANGVIYGFALTPATQSPCE